MAAGVGAVSALAEALIAAQAELPTALGKDADNTDAGYRYLTLDKLIAATRPILNAHDLTITQWPSLLERGTEGAMPTLTTVLTHSTGESRETAMPLYLRDKDMQGLGTAITYARRYAWQSVLGIAADEDTDAVHPLDDPDIPF